MLSNFRKTSKNQQAFWANDVLFHLGNLTHIYLHKQIIYLVGSVSADSANEYTEEILGKVWPVGGTVMWPNTVVSKGKKKKNKATNHYNKNSGESKLSPVKDKPFTDSEYLILAPCA